MTAVSRSVEGTLSRQLAKLGFPAVEIDAMVGRVAGIPNLSKMDPNLLSYTLIFYSTILIPIAIQTPDQLPSGPELASLIVDQLNEIYKTEYKNLDSINQAQLQIRYYQYLDIIDANQTGINPIQMIRERLD